LAPDLAKFFSLDSIATHILEKVGILESRKKAAVEPPYVVKQQRAILNFTPGPQG
jgi:hypothetical protein